jgi:hypothetical protein
MRDSSRFAHRCSVVRAESFFSRISQAISSALVKQLEELEAWGCEASLWSETAIIAMRISRRDERLSFHGRESSVRRGLRPRGPLACACAPN